MNHLRGLEASTRNRVMSMPRSGNPGLTAGWSSVMFGSIGMPELLIILFIALIIFGPRKLPELGRSLGKSIGEFKKASNELRSTLDEEIRFEEQSDQRTAIRAEQDTAIAAATPPPSATPPPVTPASPVNETVNRTTGTDPVV